MGCDILLMGQLFCIEVYIYFDIICLFIDELWLGVSIELLVVCEGDEVQLIIENVGDVDMMQQLCYIVIEDYVIMLEDEFFGFLMVGQLIIILWEVNGMFYCIESEQEFFYFGLLMLSVFIEVCGIGEDGMVSLGFVNQYFFNDGDYYIDIICMEVLVVYDFNVKYVYLVGYESLYFIEVNIKIDYQIYFQNMGMVIVNKVVLMDELFIYLDFIIICLGVSSYDYEFELMFDGIICFIFNDIQLFDSISNELGLYGFVQFSVV